MSSATAASAEDWQVIDEELKYNVKGELGSGGYGTVFKGKYVVVESGEEIDVAVKRIDPTRVEKLLEDEILAKVGNHPNVIHFYDAKGKVGMR